MQNNDTTSGPDGVDASILSIRPYLPVNAVAPIVKAVVHPNGYVSFERCYNGPKTVPFEGEKRSAIVTLSAKARRRMFRRIATSGIHWRSMLTLTYPEVFPRDGTMVKDDLDQALQWLRDQSKVSYFWFLEFQRRGAPHVHILLSEPARRAARAKFARFWARRLGRQLNLSPEEIEHIRYVHNRSKAWSQIRKKDGAIRYVAKYAYKTKQKEVPLDYQNVGRFWGCSRDVQPAIVDEIEMTDETARIMLSALDHPAADYEILPSLLWGVQFEEIPSPKNQKIQIVE